MRNQNLLYILFSLSVAYGSSDQLSTFSSRKPFLRRRRHGHSLKHLTTFTETCHLVQQFRGGEISLLGNNTQAPNFPHSGTLAITRIASASSNFWRKGILSVHKQYLQLLWDITKTSSVILFPVALLFLLGMLVPEISATTLASLLRHLQRIKDTLHSTKDRMISVPVSLSSSEVAFLLQPIIDGVLYRWLIKSLWDRCSTSQSRDDDNNKNNDHALRWSVLSSLLYGFAHLMETFAAPDADLLKIQLIDALSTREIVFLGMTLRRRSWDPNVIEYLLRAQPILQALGRGVISGVLSWGLLCPLYHMYGLLSSVGAQYAWQILSLINADIQILVRLFVRIFLPWSTPVVAAGEESPDGATSHVVEGEHKSPIFVESIQETRKNFDGRPPRTEDTPEGSAILSRTIVGPLAGIGRRFGPASAGKRS